jgi:hypothetical protein
MTYQVKKPVSKFAFQTQRAALQRGTLSGKTSKGAFTLEKSNLSPNVKPGSEVEVVPTYKSKGSMKAEDWPDVQKAAVKMLKDTLPADPMTVVGLCTLNQVDP